MWCLVFQKYPVHRLVAKLSMHRHAEFWNIGQVVVCPVFQAWSFNASSHNSERHLDAVLKHRATPKTNQMANRSKTFTVPPLCEIWGTSSTKRREFHLEGFWNKRHSTPRRLFQNVHLSAAPPIYIPTVHLSTKRRELRHRDFWNIRHATQQSLFQNVHLSAVSSIYLQTVHSPR